MLPAMARTRLRLQAVLGVLLCGTGLAAPGVAAAGGGIVVGVPGCEVEIAAGTHRSPSGCSLGNEKLFCAPAARERPGEPQVRCFPICETAWGVLPPLCGSPPFPVCGGACPQGQICTAVAGENAGICVCADPDAACGGRLCSAGLACPGGLVCTPSGDGCGCR
jgi:hypothetical protein